MHPEVSASTPAATTPRFATLDAYRGFVMLLLMAEALQLSEVAQAIPASRFWAFLGFHQSHVEWVGLSLHDLIQPSFSFLVGAALPFSIASRERRGETRTAIVVNAFRRGLILILIGIFLRSIGKPLTYFTFEDTLTQIGLGYGVLVLLAWQSTRVLWSVFAAILAIYWLAFAVYPAPDAGMAAPGVAKDWPHQLTGFAAHWNKNTNFAADFDVWLLNLFPRESVFKFNEGGYQTLNFIPTIATMILGLIAARVLRAETPPGRKFIWLLAAGAVGIALGMLLDWIGVCPIIKRIWTPSFVLVSGGFCLWFVAAFYITIDWMGSPRWAFGLLVIGTNSIAAYVLTETLRGFIGDLMKAHIALVTHPFTGMSVQPALAGSLVVAILWYALYQMYQRGIFLKV